MIPLHDVIPTRRTPWVTLVLLAVNLAVALAYPANWLAVIVNLVALWIFGEKVEDLLGRVRFVALYLLTGGAAAALGAWLLAAAPGWPLAATGSIAGVIGAYHLLLPNSRVHVLIVVPFFLNVVELPALLLAAAWLFSHAVHANAVTFLALLAGAVTGVIAALVLRPARDWYWREGAV